MWQSHNDTLCCTPSTGKSGVMAVTEELGYSSVLASYRKCWHTHEGARRCWLVLQSVANVGPFSTQIQVKNGGMVPQNLPKEDELQMFAISGKMATVFQEATSVILLNVIAWDDSWMFTFSLSVLHEKCVKCCSTITVPCHTSAYTGGGGGHYKIVAVPNLQSWPHTITLYFELMVLLKNGLWGQNYVDDEALKNVVFQQLQRNESIYTGWEHLFLFKGGRRLVTNIRSIWKNNYAFRNFVIIFMYTMQPAWY